MHQIRCANSDQEPAFSESGGVLFCNVHYLVKEDDVEKETKRRCYNCNSNEWFVNKTNITEKDYFKKMLQDPDATIGYHVVDVERSLYTETFTKTRKL